MWQHAPADAGAATLPISLRFVKNRDQVDVPAGDLKGCIAQQGCWHPVSTDLTLDPTFPSKKPSFRQYDAWTSKILADTVEAVPAQFSVLVRIGSNSENPENPEDQHTVVQCVVTAEYDTVQVDVPAPSDVPPSLQGQAHVVDVSTRHAVDTSALPERCWKQFNLPETPFVLMLCLRRKKRVDSITHRDDRTGLVYARYVSRVMLFRKDQLCTMEDIYRSLCAVQGSARFHSKIVVKEAARVTGMPVQNLLADPATQIRAWCSALRRSQHTWVPQVQESLRVIMAFTNSANVRQQVGVDDERYEVRSTLKDLMERVQQLVACTTSLVDSSSLQDKADAIKQKLRAAGHDVSALSNAHVQELTSLVSLDIVLPTDIPDEDIELVLLWRGEDDDAQSLYIETKTVLSGFVDNWMFLTKA